MEYDELVDSLTPDVLARLRQAVETGYWPDGREVTPEQREHSLQAIIAWEAKHLPPEQRVGFIDKGRKGERSAMQESRNEASPLRWSESSGGDA